MGHDRWTERLADYEVDQAFAQSLRQATAETKELKGDTLKLQHRVIGLQQTVKEDQARIAEQEAIDRASCAIRPGRMSPR
ncbi:MAG TPA: hypothetical protein VK578_08640 [Edaphobacter sp.]|nr:hypothetical protein [Edaphobacter sp.]